MVKSTCSFRGLGLSFQNTQADLKPSVTAFPGNLTLMPASYPYRHHLRMWCPDLHEGKALTHKTKWINVKKNFDTHL